MMGTLGVLLVIWFIRVILYYLIGCIVVRTGRGKKVRERFKKALFYRDLIFIMTWGYLTFLIAFALKFYSPEENNLNGWQFICTWFLAIVCFVLIPIEYTHSLITKSSKEIMHPLYQQRFGALFWNLKMRNKYDAFFYFNFMLRRILYVVIAFSLVPFG